MKTLASIRNAIVLVLMVVVSLGGTLSMAAESPSNSQDAAAASTAQSSLKESETAKFKGGGFFKFLEHKDYADVFYKLNIGYEYVTINSAFDKGFPRIGLLFYTKYFDKHNEGVQASTATGENVATGNRIFYLGMHNIITAYLTSSAESTTNINSVHQLKNFGDKRSLEVESEFFFPMVRAVDKKLLIGPVGVVGIKKVDDNPKGDGKFYAGLRFALCPEVYSEVIYGRTESIASQRVEVRAQFPLVNSLYIGAIGNIGVVNRDISKEADSIRLYMSWNISPEDMLNKVFNFGKQLAETK